MRVVVVGTGYVGLPAALMWAKACHTVVGVDIDKNVVRAINERSMLINEARLGRLLNDRTVKKHLVARDSPCEADAFVIAVPTPIEPLRKACDLSAVRAAVEALAPYLQRGNLLVIESTVPPMTCRATIKPMIEKLTSLRVPQDVLLAHCPERILPGDVFREIVENDRIVGGLDRRSARAAAALYAAFVKGALHLTDDVTAELSKLLENTYRDVNVALANEFAVICETLGVDAKTVIRYANNHPRVHILDPGIGVGGHCIPVDPWLLKEVSPDNARLISTARMINDEMPMRIAARIRRLVADISNPRIVVLGAAYKKNCEDTRESPALKIVASLRLDGYRVSHFDPLVPGLGYRSLVTAARGADLLAILVGHDRIMRELHRRRATIESVMRTARIERLDA